MSHKPAYTVATLTATPVKVNRAASEALRAFRRSKPWQGSTEERRVKFEAALAGLADAYGLPAPALKLVRIGAGPGNGGYLASANAVVLVGKLSVVTLLHALARARGMDHKGACRWSLSVFKRFFPLSFARCRQDGFTLRRD